MKLFTYGVVCALFVICGCLSAAEDQKMMSVAQFEQMEVAQQEQFLSELSAEQLGAFMKTLNMDQQVRLAKSISSSENQPLQAKYYVALTAFVNGLKTPVRKEFTERLKGECENLKVDADPEGKIEQIAVKTPAEKKADSESKARTEETKEEAPAAEKTEVLPPALPPRPIIEPRPVPEISRGANYR